MKEIPVTDIIPFLPYCGLFPIKLDMVYADESHPENHFGQIYHPQGKLVGHRDLVKIVLLAARRLHSERGWTLIVKDCLRPVEAQKLMIETPIVKANPHWLEEPRFLSSPGQGGHPRGMAVDLSALDQENRQVDFGTCFDHFSSGSGKDVNPAHREYEEISEIARRNRRLLEEAMVAAARDFNLPMLPLPQEWWDFRFPASYTKEFAFISNEDLPLELKVTTKASGETGVDDQLLMELDLLSKSASPVIGPDARP